MPPTVTPGRRNVPLQIKFEEEIIRIQKPIFEDRVYERPVYVDKIYEIPKIKYVDKIIEVPIDRIIYNDVVIERPVWRDVIVERVTFKDVIIERPVYVDKLVQVPQVTIKEETKIVPREHYIDADKVRFVDRLVEVPIFKNVVVKSLCTRCGKVETS